MRYFILGLAGLSVFFAMSFSAVAERHQELSADSSAQRWLPQTCVLTLDVERAVQDGVEDPDETNEARWNRFYRLGIDAIGNRDLEQARIDFCQALAATVSFGPRDIRFAETLDELGLVAFMSEDYETSEAMQGAAVAEMLLALGPPAENLCETAKKSCKSSVASYMTRLGWIFERQGRGGDIEPLMNQPHLILEKGYVPYDSLRERLDWLIGRYLLDEDFAAADRLSTLRADPP